MMRRWRVGTTWKLLLAVSATLTACQPDTDGLPQRVEVDSTQVLPQAADIAVQVSAGGQWNTVHAAADGLKFLATMWCDSVQVHEHDSKLYEFTQSAGGTLAQCASELVEQRAELCAGSLLEQIARDPNPREFPHASVQAAFAAEGGGSLSLPDNGWPLTGREAGPAEAPLATAGLMIRGADIEQLNKMYSLDPEGSTPSVRTLPLKPEGRAGVLRAAADLFLAAARSAGANNACLATLIDEDQNPNGQPTPFNAKTDGSRYTWTDLRVQTFADAANEYNRVVALTLDAMRDAAHSQMSGQAPSVLENQTAWNGAQHSIRALGSWLAFGPAPESAVPSTPNGEFAHDASEIGPSSIPACPPAHDAGTQRGLSLLRQLKLSPSVSASDALSAVTAAFNEDRVRAGATATTTTAGMSALTGVSADDLTKANTYLLAQSQKFGQLYIPAATKAATPEMQTLGVAPVTRYAGGGTPATSLPAGVVMAHFLGAVNPISDELLSPSAYGDGGAIRALDELKFYTFQLAQVTANVTLSAEVSRTLQLLYPILNAAAGQRRLEFYIGSPALQDTTLVDHVYVYVHGVPVDDDGNPTERYYAVQGLEGLNCLLKGKQTSADPCNPATAGVPLSNVADLDPSWADLPGPKSVSADVTYAPTGPNGGKALTIGQPLYVVKYSDSSHGEPVGGVVLSVGSQMQLKNGIAYTRHVMAPFGGAYEGDLAKLMAGDRDDCSKIEASCAGLPLDMWPPLQSEINGDPASQPFEQSWKHYLDLAQQAADNADRLGDDLIQSGLTIDQRSEDATMNLEALCGADPNGCRPEQSDSVSWLGLGDAQACLWKVGDELCGCPFQDQSLCPVQGCIITLKDADGGLSLDDPAQAAGQCDQIVRQHFTTDLQYTGALANGFQAIAVAHAVGFAKTMSEQLSPAPCTPFDNLRTSRKVASSGGSYDLADPHDRARYIKDELYPTFPQADMQNAARNISYEEFVGDHYALKYGEHTVFDTRRTPRVIANDQTLAPCHITPADTATGSTFWSLQHACYESGINCAAPPSTVGHDGCPDLYQNDVQELSLDTEPAALRRRWAWGFGDLRRSVATLGVLTGQLDRRMTVMGLRVATPADTDGVSCAESGLGFCHEASPGTDELPRWINECDWSDGNGAQATFPCIGITGGREWGRPVNYNGFIPSFLYSEYPYVSPSNRYGDLFPCTFAGGGCSSIGGVDPQMVYCAIPDPIGNGYNDWVSGVACYPSGFENQVTTWVGRSYPVQARFPDGSRYAADQNLWWRAPTDHLCDDDTADPTSAVWRAFCLPPNSTTSDACTGNDAMMHFGQRVGVDDQTYVNGSDVADKLGWSDYTSNPLMDQRQTGHVFQYPLTRQNIADALELACHAAHRKGSAGAAASCTADTIANLAPDDVEGAQAAMNCVYHRLQAAAGSVFVGPVPQPVVDSLMMYVPLPTTSGAGGQYLQSLTDEYNAIVAIQQAFNHIADAAKLINLDVQNVKLLQSNGEELSALKQAQIAQSVARTVAKIAADLVDTVSLGTIFSFGSNAMAKGVEAVADATAGVAELDVIAHSNKIEVNNNTIQTNNVMADIVQQLGHVRDEADNINTQVGALAVAASSLKTVQKEASQYQARVAMSDCADSSCADPQFYTAALRKVYATKLIRYEEAFKRAKQLAFIARRAIELRYGIDMNQMAAPMTLVDAPNKWVNDVCSMTGIDYAQIRNPNPANVPDGGAPSGSSWDGGPLSPVPLLGDDFADQYIGDYVRKLQDFVNSYPFDYPLQDGDDIGVISLGEEVLGAHAICADDSVNRLYFSGELDRRDTPVIGPDTTGWITAECGLELPGVGSWIGCVSAQPIGRTAESPDVDAGQGAALPDGGIPLAGLPVGVRAYLVRNQPCDYASLGDGGAGSCPSVGSYTARGAVAQDLRDLAPGAYLASIYARDSEGQSTSPAERSPTLRVVLADDPSTIVAETALAVTSSWQRFVLPFQAATGVTYRLEILPYAAQNALTLGSTADSWPSVLVAAAQVELGHPNNTDGTVTPAPWAATGGDRTATTMACHAPPGPELRKRFTRYCEYVCPDGIRPGCKQPSHSGQAPTVCYYESNFDVALEGIESGSLIPSGQIAIGNFNHRHNRIALNFVGTGVVACDDLSGAACNANGFVEYSLTHGGNASIRNWEGGTLPVHMDTANVEHAKGLAAERVITNPPSSSDSGLLEPYMKEELKGRPIEGSYRLRVWETPALHWDKVQDIQLVWKYHYWTRSAH